MQRKFLEDLKLEKEVIDKIMAENGGDIEKIKSRLEAERDDYKTRLEAAQAALKSFDGVNVEEMKEKIASLTSDMAAKESEFQIKIADMEFNSVLDSAISSSGARNAKALKALLDLDALKESKNQSSDIKAAIEAVKAENDYLFVSKEPFLNPVKDTGTPPSGKKMTLSEAMRYANNHPETDVKTLF